MNTFGMELNVYAAPALLTLVLLAAETVFLVFFLPETRGKRLRAPPTKVAAATSTSAPSSTQEKVTKREHVDRRIALLKTLRRLHFLFLCVFSGVEFTLTFLTFDRQFLRNLP